jgi:carboxybiotin decarboxylase
MNFLMKILSLFTLSGFAALTKGNIIILLVGGVLLLYLAIAKKFEPLLLLPIGFGAVLVNLPLAGLMEEGGLLYFISFGINHEIFPCLIFMGIGAMTDFGPLLS